MSDKTEIVLPDKAEDLGYLSLPPDLHDHGSIYRAETFAEKFKRKTKENPVVPFGLALTTFALTYGLVQLKTGNTKMSQKMMRMRIAAQGFTVFALMGGVAYDAHKRRQARKLATYAASSQDFPK